MESVCAKELQKYGISVEVYKEKEEEDTMDRRRCVLRGLDDGCFSDNISVYIDSCSRRAAHTWEAVAGDSIVITFKEDIGGYQLGQSVKTYFRLKVMSGWVT